MNGEFERPDLQGPKKSLVAAADSLKGRSDADLKDLFMMLPPEAQELLVKLAAAKHVEQIRPAENMETVEPDSWEKLDQEFARLKSDPAFEVVKALAILTKGGSGFDELVPLEDLKRLEQAVTMRGSSGIATAREFVNTVKEKISQFPSRYNPARFINIFEEAYDRNSDLVELAMKFGGLERLSPKSGTVLRAHELGMYDIASTRGGGSNFRIIRVSKAGYIKDGRWIRTPEIEVEAF